MTRRTVWVNITAGVCILITCILFLLQCNIIVRLPHSFYPNVIHINAGETLTFINATSLLSLPASGPHPTHSGYPAFDAQEGIKPWHMWSFRFAQEGVYPFHDHYAPEVTGIVVTDDTDISLMTDQAICDALTDEQERTSCISIYFRNVTATASYNQARSIYENIAIAYPSNCHEFAHELGKNAYHAYQNGTLGEIGQEASSCAYGFWHGFTTAMQIDQGFEASKDFCATMQGVNDELVKENRINCYHGIGIGLIPDPPLPHLSGNFQAIINPALAFCDSIQGEPVYRERCLTGIFHIMTNNLVNHVYGFSLDDHSLHYCTEQKPEHQYACFITLVSAVPILTKGDLPLTTAIIATYSPSWELFEAMFENAAIMTVNSEDPVEKMGDFVSTCASIHPELRLICIRAVVNDIYTNGTPGLEYQKAAAFCDGSWLQHTEAIDCFGEVVSFSQRAYAPEKMVDACNVIPPLIKQNMAACSAS